MLEAIVSTGIDALDPIDPLGGMSVARVRERYPFLPIKGGAPLSDLSIGSPSKVTSEALRCLEESGGCGYILSSTNSITGAVKPENFLAMLGAVKVFEVQSWWGREAQRAADLDNRSALVCCGLLALRRENRSQGFSAGTSWAGSLRDKRFSCFSRA